MCGNITDGLELNTFKCNKKSFTRSNTKLIMDYYIFEDSSEEVNTFCDLKVIFETNFSFSSYIEQISSKSQ